MRLHFHSDPSHGWLAVKRDLLYILGIADAISVYSYQNGKTVYLEEDCDAPKFLKAYEAKYGCKPEFVESTTNGPSRIRSYSSYKKDVAK